VQAIEWRKRAESSRFQVDLMRKVQKVEQINQETTFRLRATSNTISTVACKNLESCEMMSDVRPHVRTNDSTNKTVFRHYLIKSRMKAYNSLKYHLFRTLSNGKKRF